METKQKYYIGFSVLPAIRLSDLDVHGAKEIKLTYHEFVRFINSNIHDDEMQIFWKSKRPKVESFHIWETEVEQLQVSEDKNEICHTEVELTPSEYEAFIEKQKKFHLSQQELKKHFNE